MEPAPASPPPPLPPFNAVFSGLPTTVFEKMSRLAAAHASINLGQGFPDRELEGPASMKAVVAAALADYPCQYPPMPGVPELRAALAAHSERYTGVPLADPAAQVLVTVGATEALAAAFLGLLNPGDEVVLFAPLYDSYAPMVRRAGAVPVVVHLRPPQWTFDPADLAAAFGPRTRLAVVNTPHNPTGKVWTPEELGAVAAAARAAGARVLADEVYEHLVHPGSGRRHVSIATLEGMAERTLRVGSAGKTFSFTDFKVGWAMGPADAVGAAAKAHQFLTFTVNSALQRAVAAGLERERGFYEGLGPLLEAKRGRLAARLGAIGFEVLPAQGTYFLVADFAPLRERMAGEAAGEDDVEFCYRLTREAGVTLIPVSAFYEDPAAAPCRTLVRFVTCKTDEKLDAACDALERYFGGASG